MILPRSDWIYHHERNFSSSLSNALLPESLWEYSVQPSDPAALGFLHPWSDCLALFRIQSLPGNHLPSHLDYAICDSSVANFRCLKCTQVRFTHHNQLDDGWFFLMDGWTITTWVHPPGRSFADRAWAKGKLSKNLHAAALSYWQSDQDAVTISSVSGMYRTAFICLFWGWDFFCATCRFKLPCHMSNKS